MFNLYLFYYSPNENKHYNYLQNIDKPFQTIHVDHYGPIAITKQKNRFLFLMVDAFTKFVRIYACRSTTAQELSKCCKDHVRSYSPPKVIISDRGSRFKSKEFIEYIETLSAKHILVAILE